MTTENNEVTIYYCETGKTITRKMNADEVAQNVIDQQSALDYLAEMKAQNLAKASALAKLAALGLTEDEVKAIVG